MEEPRRDTFVIYPRHMASLVNEQFFEPEFLRDRSKLIGRAQGRGVAWFFEHEDNKYVLRHYYRGGLVAKLSRDQYIWRGLEQTRPYREMGILQQLAIHDAPVALPFAARVTRHGLRYRADIITCAIAGAQTLVQRLVKGAMPEGSWRDVGAAIAAVHATGVYHADLNAHNILFDSNEQVFIIDFDKAQLLGATHAKAAEKSGEQLASDDRQWRDKNLQRLQRSLRKEKAKCSELHFDESGWQALCSAYQNACALVLDDS